jgi:hypothetical protein
VQWWPPIGAVACAYLVALVLTFVVLVMRDSSRQVDVADFAKGTEDDLAGVPYAEHVILTPDRGQCFMSADGESPETGRAVLDTFLVSATSATFIYCIIFS